MIRRAPECDSHWPCSTPCARCPWKRYPLVTTAGSWENLKTHHAPAAMRIADGCVVTREDDQ